MKNLVFEKNAELMMISNHLIEITKKVYVKKDVNEKEMENLSF
jgi:hypothetical protein